MYWEIIIVLFLAMIPLFYGGIFSKKTFLDQETGLARFLKEKDYNFLIYAKYGEKASANEMFEKRLTTALYGSLIFSFFVLTDFSVINLVVWLVVTVALYKMPYIQLKSYRKKYMSQIDMLLPYYLKNLEILCQNYTVPVALARSIDSAPDVFKLGLRELVAKIDAGDSSIQPYMDFAMEYPVKDSMRMMRLLYRLGLGAQENKYKQLLTFSKSVSTLQNKARELKYKNRLSVMERKTMIMLVVTGGGTMVILLLSMMLFMGF